MRRYSVHEAPRAILTHELGELIYREEHLNPDRPERAEAYRRALAEIEMGSPATMARHTRFRINEALDARYGITEGTREEILDELDRYRADRAQQGKQGKASRYAKAIAQVGKGAREVEVDRIRYRVVEDDLGEPERHPGQAAIDAERDARVSAAQDGLCED